jgi:LysM repeat protein
MKYIKPHLSPELRAQITPHNRRDRSLATAGVIFLILAGVLTINLIPRGDAKQLATELPPQNSLPQVSEPEDKQVLGLSTKEEAVVEPQPQPTEQFTSYTVKNGDTLFNISQEYNISWSAIAEINGLAEPYVLHGGQTLKIPQATTSKVPGKVYTIKTGDTLASIAKAYNITVADIIAVNPNLQKSDLITVGQIIKLP